MTERIEPLDGEPWDIDIPRDAIYQVENARDDLEEAGMLSANVQATFDALIKLLEAEIEGFIDANRY